MNAREQLFGTLIFSILFVIWVLVSWAVFPTIFMNALRANETSSLLILAFRILTVSGALCVMPPIVSIAALRVAEDGDPEIHAPRGTRRHRHDVVLHRQ